MKKVPSIVMYRVMNECRLQAGIEYNVGLSLVSYRQMLQQYGIIDLKPSGAHYDVMFESQEAFVEFQMRFM